jgi:hypothetical protein
MRTQPQAKAYRVVNKQTGAVVFESNNLVVADRRAEKLGPDFAFAFNYEVNQHPAKFVGMVEEGGEMFALYSGVAL